MATIYTWTFPQLEVAPSEDGLTDVVKVIHWRLDAMDGVYNAGSYGTVALSAPDPASYTPYADITEQWAIDAMSNNIDVAAMKASMDGEIAKKKNPPTVPMPAPFPQP